MIRRVRLELICERILLPSVLRGAAKDLRLSFAFCDFPLVTILPRNNGVSDGQVDFGGSGKSCEFEFPGRLTEYPLWMIVEAKIGTEFVTITTGQVDCSDLTANISLLPKSVSFTRMTLETAEGVGILFQLRLVRSGEAARAMVKVDGVNSLGLPVKSKN